MTQPETTHKVLPRVIVLALVVALGQLWLNHHLGWGGDTPWIAGILFVATFADKFLAKVISKEEKEKLDTQLKQTLEPVLSGTLPMLLSAVAVIVALGFSSMIIIPGNDLASSGKSVKARLLTLDRTPVDVRDLGTEKAGARFRWLRTSPFGRPYRLAVDGYLEEVVAVYPIVGLKVIPDRDLRRSPTVLFRLQADAITSFASGGTFSVTWRIGTGPVKVLVPPQRGNEGSILVGRGQANSAVAVNTWRLELVSGGVEEPTLSKMILGWSRPRVVEPAIPPAPGMTLVAEIRSRTGKVVARSDEIELGTEAFVDVSLLTLPEGG